MPLTEKGKKVKAAMTKQYGPKKGAEVFYASERSGKLKGVAKKKNSTEKGKGFAKGGSVTKAAKSSSGTKANKSRVNEAGNYTKPSLRKRLFEKIKAGTKGGNAGQWSARKAQMLAREYKAAGGGYK